MNISYTKIILTTFALLQLCSCQNLESSSLEDQPNPHIYTSGRDKHIIPTFPKSAENRLLEVINGTGISDISEMAYTGGVPTYLGIDGHFWQNGGENLYASFVLSIEQDEITWENAKVYKWMGQSLTYKNNNGDRVVKDVYSVGELISLPDRVLTNLLYEITGPEQLVWTKEEVDSRRSPYILSKGEDGIWGTQDDVEIQNNENK